MADDRLVAEQTLDVPRTEPGDEVRIEPLERCPEAVALAQDRQPRKPRLKALQAESLVQPALVADRAAPFLVVVGDVTVVRGLPAAFYATSTLTVPSSTTTG